MRIEHIGICVDEPLAAADWYCNNLGGTIRLSSGDNQNGGAFVADSAGRTIIELFHSSTCNALPHVQSSPSQVHIALMSDDPHSDAKRLIAAGATFLSEIERKTPQSDIIVMLRDPFGLTLQLVKRLTTNTQL